MKNLFVCQKMQTWTLSRVTNLLIKLKYELEEERKNQQN